MSRRESSSGFLATRRSCLYWCASLVAASIAGCGSRRSWNSRTGFAGLSAIEIAAGLRAGEWKSHEVTEWCLRRIARVNGAFERFDDNGGLNAFVRVFADMALAASDAADRAGAYPDWTGVPVALKDVFDVRSMPVTVGTPAYRTYRAAGDCTVWKKWRSGGAVLIGHTQCQRFETGVTTPQTANPWNPRLIAGGSSGGSAAAVAAGLVPVALGAETDGSMIYPAACCGVTTLKPSHGLLSLAGVYPGLPSFDVVGPLARSAADCAWALAILAGEDELDPLTAAQQGHEMSWPDTTARRRRSEQPLRGVRFLISTNERYSNLRTRAPAVVDPRIQKTFQAFLRTLTELGAEIIAAEIPHDLGRYGTFRTEKRASLGGLTAHDVIETVDSVSAHFPGVNRWLAQARESERAIAVHLYGGRDGRVESEEFLATAARVNAQTLRGASAAREELRDAWERMLTRHDCDAHVYLEIGSPPPERRGIDDTPPPDASREGVVPCDLGWPVLSMPVGMPAELDTPVSAQIMARRWHDHRLLLWGIEWQRRHPQPTPRGFS